MPIGLDGIAGLVLNKQASSLNSFVGSVAKTFTGPIDALSKKLRTAANPYKSRLTLSAMQAVSDPVLACDWIAAVIGHSPLTEIDPLLIDSFQSPQLGYDVQSTFRNGKFSKTAGASSVGDINIGLYTDIDGQSINWGLDWYYAVQRSDGYYNLPSVYWKDIVLFVLDAKNQTVVDFRYVNCVPTSFASYQFGSESTLLKTDLTIATEDVLRSSSNDLSAVSARINSIFPTVPGISGLAGF
jgi:hypothetical protein